MDFVDKKIANYAAEHTQEDSGLLQQLKEETYEKLEIPHMLTGRVEGRFLRMLAFLLGARRIVEVGTFSGYSALSMAEALSPDGKLITCDNDPVACAFARRYFAQSEHGGKIELREGAALETLKTLSGPFDMAFIDADKVNYAGYYDAILPMLRTGGLIVVDNVLWSGRVLDPRDEVDKCMHAFNEKIINDARVDQVMLTVRDGIYCLRKK